jgi:hypothetical protein
MTTMEPAPRQVAVKVSLEGNRLITSGAHYLRMSKKHLVEAAVVFYLNARREEMQADPGSRPYARTTAKPRKQGRGRKNYPHPPCRIGGAAERVG